MNRHNTFPSSAVKSAQNSAELLRETLFLGCAQALRRMLLGLLITGKIGNYWSYHWETIRNGPKVQWSNGPTVDDDDDDDDGDDPRQFIFLFN